MAGARLDLNAIVDDPAKLAGSIRQLDAGVANLPST
jgi:hypothetical protein